MKKTSTLFHLGVLFLGVFVPANAQDVIATQEPAPRPQYAALNLSWSPDGRRVAVSGTPEITIWDAQTQTRMYSFLNESDSFVLDHLWSADSSQVVILSDDQTLSGWAIGDTQAVQVTASSNFPPILSYIETLDWRDNQTTVIASGCLTECYFHEFDAQTLAYLGSYSGGGYAIDIHPFADLIAYSSAAGFFYSEGGPWFLDLSTLQHVTVGTKDVAALDLAWNNSGTQIAVGYTDGTVIVWDTETNASVFTGELGEGVIVHRVAWHPNDDILIAADYWGFVRMWQISTGQLIWDAPVGTARLPAFSPNGHFIAFEELDGTLEIIPVPDGSAVSTSARVPVSGIIQ